MSDSINDIAIKLGIDMSGVTAGLQAVSSKLRRFKEESPKLLSNPASVESAGLKMEWEEQKAQTAALAAAARERTESTAAEAARDLANKRKAADEAAAIREREANDRQVFNLQQKRLADAATNDQREADARTNAAARKAADERALIREREADDRQRQAAANKAMIAKGIADADAETARLIASRRASLNAQTRGSNGKPIDDQYEVDRRARTAAKLRDIADAERALANAERERLDVERQINAITQRNMNATERYKEEIENLNQLQYRPNVSMTQRMAEGEWFNRERVRLKAKRDADTALEHMNETKDPARIMTGVFGQLSFAAEDFFQGITFGDVRSALQGASNNLTMVARGLWQVNTASGTAAISLGTVAVAAGGIAAAGVAAYAAWYMFSGYAIASAKELEDSMKALDLSLNRFKGNLERRQNARAFDNTLRDMKSAEEAYKDIQSEQAKSADMQDELQQRMKESIVVGKGEAQVRVGGERAKDEMIRYLGEIKNSGSEMQRALADESSKLYAEMEEAAGKGDASRFTAAADKLHWTLRALQKDTGDWLDLQSVNALGKFSDTSWFERGVSQSADALALEVAEMQKRGDELKKLGKDIEEGERQILELKKAQLALLIHEEELREKANQKVRDKLEMELIGNDIAKKQAAEEERRLEARKKFMAEWNDFPLVKDGPVEERSKAFDAMWEQSITDEKRKQSEAARDELNIRREQMLLEMRGTELQKEKAKVLKEQADYIGTTAAEAASIMMAMQVGAMGGGLGGGAAAAAFAQIEADASLEFLKAKKTELEKEILNMTPQTTVASGLGTDKFQVAADAITQALRSEFTKSNPQLEVANRLLDEINRAIAAGGPRLVAVP